MKLKRFKSRAVNLWKRGRENIRPKKLEYPSCTIFPENIKYKRKKIDKKKKTEEEMGVFPKKSDDTFSGTRRSLTQMKKII